MVVIRTALVYFAAIVTGVLAAQDSISVALQLYPTCAITCLAETVPGSACELDDSDCLCHDEPLNNNLTACVRETCSTVDALAARNASATLCEEPIRDVSTMQGLLGVVGCSITLLIFFVRIVSNLSLNGGGFGWDGYLITAAMVATIGASVLAPISASYGVGRDIWTLPVEDIEKALLYFLIGELAYFTAVGLAKASILMFMLRIFPDKRFRAAVLVVVALVAAYTTAFLFATVFQCQPVQYFWKQLDDTARGQCNNINLQAWLSAALNIVLDLIILVLPLRSLWSLQLTMAKKFTVMAMFSLGIFVTIISAIRMHTFIVFSSSINFTWDYKDGGTWSLIELYASIVCACLPSMRILVQYLRSKRLGQTTYGHGSVGNSQNYETNNGSSAKHGGSCSHRETQNWSDENDSVCLVEMSREPNKKTGVRQTIQPHAI